MDSEQKTLGIAKLQNELDSSREINLKEKLITQNPKKITKFKLIKNLKKEIK